MERILAKKMLRKIRQRLHAKVRIRPQFRGSMNYFIYQCSLLLFASFFLLFLALSQDARHLGFVRGSSCDPVICLYVFPLSLNQL